MNVTDVLDRCDPAAPLQGGYGFLEWTGDTFHPGVDLNTPGGAESDCGNTVRCPVAGTVRHVEEAPNVGFGLHAWVEATSGEWLHFCHLSSKSCEEGASLARSAKIGECGKSGGWSHCHVHFEVKRQKPGSWDYWPKGLAKSDVAQQYINPIDWLQTRNAAGEEDMGRIQELEQRVMALEQDQARINAIKFQFERYIREAPYRIEVDNAAAATVKVPADVLISRATGS